MRDKVHEDSRAATDLSVKLIVKATRSGMGLEKSGCDEHGEASGFRISDSINFPV